MTRGGRGHQFALLSQPFGRVQPTEAPYLVDTVAPYGPRARPLLLTAPALARGTVASVAPVAPVAPTVGRRSQ